MDALVLKILVAIVLFAIPAWITRIHRKSSSRLSICAFILIAISGPMQVTYVLAGPKIMYFFLSDSVNFLTVGMALCVIGTILAMICQSRTHSEGGYIFSGATAFVLWFFLMIISH